MEIILYNDTHRLSETKRRAFGSAAVTPKKAQIYKPEYGKELLRIAEGDLASASALHETKKGRKENVGYLAQQSIEKALKAVLC